MSDEKINIDLLIKTGDSAKSVTDLKKSLKELKNAAASVDETSEDFRKLQAAAGEAKDKIDDLNQAIKSQSGEPIQKVAGSFGLMGDKLKELDFKGASGALKTLVGNMKALPFKEMISGAKAFGVTLMEIVLENPILLIIAAVVALGAAIYGLANETSKSIDKQIEKYDELEKKIEKRYDREIKLAKAAGKNTEELENKKLKITKKITDQQIKLLEMLQKSWIGLNDEQKKKLDELRDKSVDTMTDITANIISQAKEAHEKSVKETAELVAKTKKLHEEALKKRADDEKKFSDESAAAYKKKLEERAALEKKFADEAIKQREENDAKELASTTSLIDKVKSLKIAEDDRLAANEEEKVKLKNERDKAEIESEYEKSNQSAEAYQAKLDALALLDSAYMDAVNTARKDEQDKKDAANKKEIDDAKKVHDEKLKLAKEESDAKFAIANDTVNSMMALEDVVNSIKQANLEKGSAAQLAAAKKDFKIKKALSITSAVISGIQGVVNALSAQSVIPEPFGTILKVASAVGVGIAAAANVAKIAATQFNPGASGGGGAVGSAGSAPPATGNFSAASLQKIGGMKPPNMGGTGSNGQIKLPPQKVYVVSQEMTGSQNKDAVLERRASFNK